MTDLPEPPVPADLDLCDVPLPVHVIRALLAEVYGGPPPEAKVQEAIALAIEAGITVEDLQ